MKKLQRFLAAVLAASMLFCITACKSNGNSDETTETPSGESSSSVTTEKEATTEETESESSPESTATTTLPSSTNKKVTTTSTNKTTVKATETTSAVNPWLPHENLTGEWTANREIEVASYIWDGGVSSMKMKVEIYIKIVPNKSLGGYICIYQAGWTNYDECKQECFNAIMATNKYDEMSANVRAIENMNTIGRTFLFNDTAQSAFINATTIQRFQVVRDGYFQNFEERYVINGNKMTFTSTTDPLVQHYIPLTLTKK